MVMLRGLLCCVGKLALLQVAMSTAACAPAKTSEPPIDVRTFACDDGIEFSGQFQGDRAIISTRSHRYELKVRPSSIGVRYGSDSVAFAQDEERAVLVGAADGPYQNCIVDETAERLLEVGGGRRTRA